MKALIFDCDGTLVDTMPAHYRSWEQTLEPLGLSLSTAHFYAKGGWTAEAILMSLAEDAGITIDIAAAVEAKDRNHEAFMDGVRPIEPVVEIARLARGQVPMAVGTGGTRAFCTRVLRSIGIYDWFDVVVCAEDVSRCKPAPDTFLLAAHQMGIHPMDCLVYEDTDPGIEAAKAAGMKWVDIRELLRPKGVQSSDA